MRLSTNICKLPIWAQDISSLGDLFCLCVCGYYLDFWQVTDL